MSGRNSKEEYDSEPVVYCAKCYSLKIKHEDAIDADCCMECGCSDVLTATINEWEWMYARRYGHKFVEKKDNVRESRFFRMSINQLKTYVYNSPSREYIIKWLYPGFPRGLTNEESVILLFDKLIKDKRLDELRLLLNSKNYKGNGRG